MKRELRIYSKIAHRWKQIATLLGFELGEIESVEENHHRNYSRITAVLRRWFKNARSLPNASRYPKSWQGLIYLLEDAELSEEAEEMKRALSSPKNSVRGNFYWLVTVLRLIMLIIIYTQQQYMCYMFHYVCVCRLPNMWYMHAP